MRVIATHQALQLGELAHHRGEQVALRELCAAVGQRRVAADRLGDLRSQRTHALRLVVQGTELRLERHLAQCFETILETLLAVRGPEECGIRQARAHHALVAGNHLRRIGALDVRDRDEPGHQRAVPVADREVTLVFLHRRDQNLGRQLEVLHVEAAGERHRPLDEGRHFVEQGVLDDGVSAEPLRGRSHALADGLAPLVDVHQDLAALVQGLHIRRRVADAQRLRRHEAVAVGDIAGGYVEDRRVDDLLAEQHQHPVHGAHELRVAVAPAHALGDRQRVERGLHDPRQQRQRVRARFGAAKHHPRALRGLELLEGVHLDSAGLGKRSCRLRGRALRVERRLERRAALFDRAVRLLLDQLAHAHRQTARRGEMLDAFVRQPRAGESLRDAVRKRGGQRE